ncbi:hypothetical protein [Rhizobium leguminosarum]|uniref:hypothetical protein n=1 Tax=Rhizobium leguminosarum TaxID=384 RepID=UPI0013DFA0F2|nr:hypothetical protein [Rhizobium leguminosarum]
MAEAARKEEEVSRDALGRLIAKNARTPELILAGYAWQLSAARLGEAQKALADMRAKKLDWIVTTITVTVAIAFLLFVSISAVHRVNNTRVVAKVTTPQVRLRSSDKWDVPRKISSGGVFVSPVALLGVSGRPKTNFAEAASVELLGEAALTDFSVLPGTAVTLSAQSELVTFELEGANSGATPAWLLWFKVNVAPGTKLTIKKQGATVDASEILADGATLSIGVAFTPGWNASLELDKPKPWNLLFHDAKLDFHDDAGLSTIVEGTLEVPNVAKSVPLGRYDDLVVGAATKPVGTGVVNYDDKGILSVVQEYSGKEVLVAVGSEKTNVVPTSLEYLLANVGAVTTLNSLLVLVTGFILWGVRARSIYRGAQ